MSKLTSVTHLSQFHMGGGVFFTCDRPKEAETH